MRLFSNTKTIDNIATQLRHKNLVYTVKAYRELALHEIQQTGGATMARAGLEKALKEFGVKLEQVSFDADGEVLIRRNDYLGDL